MIWEKIVKKDELINLNRHYELCKEDLSIEGKHKCVYCCIHESRWGGIRNFHIEHFKPKSKFPEDRDNYKNLFYACSVCNGFKGNDWPNESQTQFDVAFYPNPLDYCYSEIININFETGFVEGNSYTGNYIVEKLFLNRKQLINERKFYWYNNKFQEMMGAYEKYICILIKHVQNEKTKIFLQDFINQQIKITNLLNELILKIPYKSQDISR